MWSMLVKFHHQQLPNGLQIIGETNPNARSVAVGFFVHTGARDETPEVSGVSHFLEHMVFKGTPHRTAFDVNRDFDAIGADYNASTGVENTVFHASVLPEYLPRVVDILADILRPSLRQEDFDMEKKVILEEISMYDDEPMATAYDRARRAHYANHPLGNSVLGTLESVGGLTRQQMLEYFQKHYASGNITVVAAGKFDWAAFVRLVSEKCGHWNGSSSERKKIPEPPGSAAFEVHKRDKELQEYVILMAPGPQVRSSLLYPAHVLTNILGDYSGSRLYWALVDPGMVESAGASFEEYDGAGDFCINFSCKPDRTQKNLDLVHGLLHQLQQEGVSEEELRQAKTKILSRLVRSAERPMGRMQTIGFTWTYLKTYHSLDDELKRYQAVNMRKIRQVLERYPITHVTTLALGPQPKLRRPALRC